MVTVIEWRIEKQFLKRKRRYETWIRVDVDQKSQAVLQVYEKMMLLNLHVTQKIRNFVVLVFIRSVKKTYNAVFISQICMEHILRRLRYNHTDNANH